MSINTTVAFQFKKKTVSTTAIALADFNAGGAGFDFAFTVAEIALAERMRVTNGANTVRYRYDGVASDSTTGHILAANAETILIGNENIRNFQIIRISGDSDVCITLEKQ